MIMKGVTMPGVSAGSNQLGAICTWTAQVICPRGVRVWAAAVLGRSQPGCQAASPATPRSVPWRKCRRISGGGVWVIQHLLGARGAAYPG
jgi:hypothetical protein